MPTFHASLSTQGKDVLAALRQATLADDLKNVIQHIHPTGEKVSLDRNLGELRNFFAAEGPAGQVDQLAMNGDFGAWYDQVLPSLMREPVGGQVALASSDPGYALLRDGLQRGHPLFASTAGGFYSNMG